MIAAMAGTKRKKRPARPMWVTTVGTLFLTMRMDIFLECHLQLVGGTQKELEHFWVQEILERRCRTTREEIRRARDV